MEGFRRLLVFSIVFALIVGIIPINSFASEATSVRVDEIVQVDFPNGLALGEEAEMVVTSLDNKQSHELDVQFGSGIQVSNSLESIRLKKGKSKSTTITISDPGEYSVSISVDGILKPYKIIVDEQYAVYGFYASQLNLEVSQPSDLIEMKLGSQQLYKENNLLSKVDNMSSMNMQMAAGVTSVEVEVIGSESIALDENISNESVVTSPGAMTLKVESLEMAALSASDSVEAYEVTSVNSPPFLIDNVEPIKCSIVNWGYNDATDVPVRILINDQVVHYVLEYVPARTIEVTTLQLTIPNPKWYEVKIQVGDESTGSSKAQNYLFAEKFGKELEYHILDTPNHVQPYSATEDISFRSLVQNTGTVDSGAIQMDLVYDGRKLGSYTVGSIEPGKLMNIWFDFKTMQEESHIVEFVFDPNHQISSKTLKQSITATWNGPGNDIVPYELSTSVGQLFTDQSNTFDFKVKNIGTAYVRDRFNCIIEANKIPYNTIPVAGISLNGIDPQQIIMGDFDLNWPYAGRWEFDFTVDNDKDISEIIETNNYITSIFEFRDKGDYVWPTDSTRITEYAGWIPSRGRYHKGIDIGWNVQGDGGDPIYAFSNGDVTVSKFMPVGGGDYGEVIYIRHDLNGKTVETRYAHMVSGSRTLSVGKTAIIGEMIGEMGNTGASSGEHLHFETRDSSGGWYDPIEEYFPQYMPASASMMMSAQSFTETQSNEPVIIDGVHISLDQYGLLNAIVLETGKGYEYNLIKGLTIEERNSLGITESVVQYMEEFKQ